MHRSNIRLYKMECHCRITGSLLPQVREVANATQWSQQPFLSYHDTAPHQLHSVASSPIRGPPSSRLNVMPQMLGYPSIQHSLTSPVEGMAHTTPGFSILPQDGPWNVVQTEGVPWQKSSLGSSPPVSIILYCISTQDSSVCLSAHLHCSCAS